MRIAGVHPIVAVMILGISMFLPWLTSDTPRQQISLTPAEHLYGEISPSVKAGQMYIPLTIFLPGLKVLEQIDSQIESSALDVRFTNPERSQKAGEYLLFNFGFPIVLSFALSILAFIVLLFSYAIEGRRLAVAGGIIAILAASSWISAWQLLKMNIDLVFTDELTFQQQGFGIHIGIGVYVAILAGVIAIATIGFRRRNKKSESPSTSKKQPV